MSAILWRTRGSTALACRPNRALARFDATALNKSHRLVEQTLHGHCHPSRVKRPIGAFLKEAFMWLVLAFLLLIGWLVAFVAFHVAFAAVHILLGLFIIFLIIHFIRRAGLA
jgi:hypothetical protein